MESRQTASRGIADFPSRELSSAARQDKVIFVRHIAPVAYRVCDAPKECRADAALYRIRDKNPECLATR